MRQNASKKHVKVKSMNVKHTAESIETMKWGGSEASVQREEDRCKWDRRKIVTKPILGINFAIPTLCSINFTIPTLGSVTIFLLFIYARLPHVGLSFHSILTPSLWSIPQYVLQPCLLLLHACYLHFDACISYMLLTCLLFTYLLHAMQAWLTCI